MSTWGMKASQLGYDVTDAADYQLLYSSEWPLLKIEAQGSYTISNPFSDQTIYTHNLGYRPLFWIFEVNGTQSGFADNLGGFGLQFFGTNTSQLRYIGGGYGTATTIRYVIFRLDLASTFTAQNLNLSPGSETIIDNYGIKIAGPGKDVSSTDYRDFVVHSDTRSPMVHSVLQQTITASSPGDPYFSPAYKAQWTHTLGYKPLYFAFVKSADTVLGNDYYVPLISGNGNHILDFSGNNIEVHTSLTNQTVSVVIFKDQLLI